MDTVQHTKLAWYNQNISYFVLDITWATIVCFMVYSINSDATTIATLLVWFVTLIFFWQASAAPIRIFSQSYRHPVRLIFSILAVSLSYFFILRAHYSISSLCLVSVFWLFGALTIRYYLSSLKSSIRVLGHPLVLEQIGEGSYNFRKIYCYEPAKISLQQFDCIVFDPKFNYGKLWQEFFVHVSTIGVPIFSLSELQELVYGKVHVELLQKSWIEQSFVLNRFYLKLKRFIDLFIIILFLPIIIISYFILALLIKFFMGTPVLFKQSRIGLSGEKFTIYKFRTMDNHNIDLIENMSSEFSINQEARITKFGKILRKFRLDELPQFYNILKGEMSLIGPRPEWVKTAQQFSEEIPLYQLRHIVRPGLTGWAQVEQGHIEGIDGNYDKLRYDLYYIKHCSIWLDLKIIVKTVQTLLFGKGV